jgi:hypothetical protein
VYNEDGYETSYTETRTQSDEEELVTTIKFSDAVYGLNASLLTYQKSIIKTSDDGVSLITGENRLRRYIINMDRLFLIRQLQLRLIKRM